MKIGFIGVGNIGGNLARRFSALGHDVVVANSRGPETLGEFAAETGATAATAGEVANGADVVVVTIPLGRVAGLPKDLLAHAKQDVVVVDTNNYYPQRDGKIAAIEDGKTESEWVAEQLGHTVIKVFNGVYAARLLEVAPGNGFAIPVAGDDEVAKAQVFELAVALGFEPVDAGSLSESWRQQPGSPSYGAELDAAGLKQALADASKVRSPEWLA